MQPLSGADLCFIIAPSRMAARSLRLARAARPLIRFVVQADPAIPASPSPPISSFSTSRFYCPFLPCLPVTCSVAAFLTPFVFSCFAVRFSTYSFFSPSPSSSRFFPAPASATATEFSSRRTWARSALTFPAMPFPVPFYRCPWSPDNSSTYGQRDLSVFCRRE